MSTTEHAAPLAPSRTARLLDVVVLPPLPARMRRTAAQLLSSVVLAALGAGVAAADVTVAFVGDQGHREDAERLMERVRDSGVDLLVLGGDLGYGDDAEPWLEMMERALGEDFPVISAVGNHELYNWPQYRAWLAARIERVPELACDGDVGVKAHCRFRGLSIVQTAPGVHEVPGVDPDDDYAGYIRDAFADDPFAWRICSWHKNQTDMQIGNKDDATGWGVYEACREAGAIVATAHEHSYSRTHLMSDFDTLEVAHRDDHLVLEPGRSFAFVSGLGGHSPRGQAREGEWWASTYALGDGVSAGALFCTFSDRSAECRFEDIKGAMPDRFTLESRVGAASSGSSDDDAAAAGGESGGDGESAADGEAVADPASPADGDAAAAGADALDAAASATSTSADDVTSGDVATDEDAPSADATPDEDAVAADAASGGSSAAADSPTTDATDTVADVAPDATFGLMAAPPPARQDDAAPPAGGGASTVEPRPSASASADDGAVPAPSEPTAPVPPSPAAERSPESEDASGAFLDADALPFAPPPSEAAPRVVTGGGGGAAAATIVTLLLFGRWRRRARTAMTRRGDRGARPACCADG